MQTKRSAHRIFGSPAGLLASAVLAVPLALFTAGAASATTPHTVQLKTDTVQLKTDTVQLKTDTVQLKTHQGQVGQHSTVQLGHPETVQLKTRTVQLTVQL